jgi:hypothetical protein
MVILSGTEPVLMSNIKNKKQKKEHLYFSRNFPMTKRCCLSFSDGSCFLADALMLEYDITFGPVNYEKATCFPDVGF